MDVSEFKTMIERVRQLEMALGSTRKFVVEEERETVIVQRRGLYANKKICKGEIINEDAINKKKSFISSKMGNHLRIQDGNISANNSKRQINIINNVFINNNQIIVHNNF